MAPLVVEDTAPEVVVAAAAVARPRARSSRGRAGGGGGGLPWQHLPLTASRCQGVGFRVRDCRQNLQT